MTFPHNARGIALRGFTLRRIALRRSAALGIALLLSALLPLHAFAQEDAGAESSEAASAETAATPDAISGTTEAVEILTDALARIDRIGSYKANLRQKMGAVMEASGTIWFQAPNRVRMEMLSEMQFAGQTLRTTMVNVMDGEHLWSEQNSPMGRQVVKGRLDDLKEQAREAGSSFGLSGNNATSNAARDILNEFAGLKNIRRLPDVQVNNRQCKVLQGEMESQPDDALNMAAILLGGAPEALRLYLDPENAFTHKLEMLIAGGAVGMTVESVNPEFGVAIPAETFTYTPPDGVAVIDLAKHLQSAPSPQ